MAITLESVVKQLEDSGIVAPGKLENFVPPKARPKNVDALVAELVRNNHLTKFQAAKVAAGKSKSLILGGYTLLDKIGEGGMGEVFKAQHRRMDRTVAIKTLPSSMTKNAGAIARFEREVRAAAKLRHPNIVAADDADQAHGVHFLVMEYVEGSDLFAFVRKNGPLPADKATNYVLQAARGLEFAHKKGIVHRDIKPSNLLLDNEGTVRILDMGLARIESEGNDATQAELTGSGAIMGSVDYMSPEQSIDSKHADARADIYSLGCTLFFLIRGKAIYGGESVIEKFMAHREKEIPSLRTEQAEVPEELEAVFRKMVAKKIEDRYQSMSDVIADLGGGFGDSHTSFGSHEPSGTIVQNSAPTFIKNKPLETNRKLQTTTEALPTDPSESKLPPRRNRKVLVGAAFLGTLILAGVIVSLKTKEGTLTVEVDQPDATVQVLDAEGKIELTRKGSDKITFSVDHGKHRLKVEKEGFVVFGEEFEMERDGKKMISAKLVPITTEAPIAPAVIAPPTTAVVTGTKVDPKIDVDRRVAEWVLKKPGSVLYIRNTPQGQPVLISTIGDLPSTDFSVQSINLHGGSLVDGEFRELERLKRLDSLWLQKVKGVNDAQLQYLSVLHDLSDLVLSSTEITDEGLKYLRPLTKLRALKLAETTISDHGIPYLSAMRSLTAIDLRKTQVTENGVIALQNAIPNCRVQWPDHSIVYDLQQPTPAKPLTDVNDPQFQAWMKQVATLPAELQVKEVVKKLQELNPGFDGAETHGIDQNVVRDLNFITATVSDISPVRALTGLKTLFSPPLSVRSVLSDLSPLQGMQLWKLDLTEARVSNLTPLNGMPLEVLICNSPMLSDLSPLRGMHFTSLVLQFTTVTDLTPLRGMPLKSLNLAGCSQVSDLSPLEECKSLISLTITGTKVTPASVAALRKALPNCKVISDDPAKPTTPQPAAPFASPEAIRAAAFQAWMKEVAAKPAEQQIEAVSRKLMDLNPGFDGKLSSFGGAGKPMIANGVVTELSLRSDSLSDISPLRALTGLKALGCAGKNLTDLSPLQGMELISLNCSNSSVSDLTPLQGMKLTDLQFGATQVSDLLPLRGMPLRQLTFFGTNVSNLSSLQGMPLTLLNCGSTPVSDLSPLRGMPLMSLLINNTKVSDLSPLEECKSMKILHVTKTKVAPAGIAAQQKAIPACKIDWDDPAKAITNQSSAPSKSANVITSVNAPAFQAWMKDVAAKPAEQQIEAVSKRLMELNPGFDGKLTGIDGTGRPKVENDAVTELRYTSDSVIDISPVRAFTRLKALYCGGTKLSDLSPLQGMSLSHLQFPNNQVVDLAPLEAMPLIGLNCGNTRVINLRPLQKMKLTTLDLHATKISDLSPLRGMPLRKLEFYGSQVSDLSPLQGMPLELLNCGSTPLSDLSPLQGLPLASVQLSGSKVADLTPLRGMPLHTLLCTGTPVSDLSPLADCKNLKSLELTKTKVTPADIAALQKALPACKITWDDPAEETSPQPTASGTK